MSFFIVQLLLFPYQSRESHERHDIFRTLRNPVRMHVHGVRKAFFEGDHQQLPPYVASIDQYTDRLHANPFAKQKRRSFMERMLLRGLRICLLTK